MIEKKIQLLALLLIIHVTVLDFEYIGASVYI